MVTRKNALGTKKERIERFSLGVPRQAPLPGKGPGDGSRKAPAWAQKKVRIERFSLTRGAPRQAPLPGKGPGDG